MYEIQSKVDFQAGTALTVRIPEEEIDKKALYTILAEKPDFVLPFRHRAIDGQVEFIYQAGSRSRIAYVSGSRSPGEYADLWVGLLQPLIDCGDWFMDPYSFVLKHEYIYCDKNGKSISFVYIPSTRACSDHSALKSMVTVIARQNHVTDVNLENEVVWAIQDFNPSEFLRMIKPYKSGAAQPSKTEQPAPAVTAAPIIPEIPVTENKTDKTDKIEKIDKTDKPDKIDKTENKTSGTQNAADDIAIDFSFADMTGGGKTPKEEKPREEKSKDEKQKEEKPKAGLFGSNKKEKNGLPGSKKPQHEAFIQDDDAEPEPPELSEPSRNIILPAAVLRESPDPDDAGSDATEFDSNETDDPKFRYAGGGEHPKVIKITVEEGGIFTIGRFDASVGVKQCGFEFDKKTKAVSRRHAAVERGAGGYSIVDLDSAAGTFINGQKLPPNAPFDLSNGCRVSFGYSGADYIWEE